MSFDPIIALSVLKQAQQSEDLLNKLNDIESIQRQRLEEEEQNLLLSTNVSSGDEAEAKKVLESLIAGITSKPFFKYKVYMLEILLNNNYDTVSNAEDLYLARQRDLKFKGKDKAIFALWCLFMPPLGESLETAESMDTLYNLIKLTDVLYKDIFTSSTKAALLTLPHYKSQLKAIKTANNVVNYFLDFEYSDGGLSIEHDGEFTPLLEAGFQSNSVQIDVIDSLTGIRFRSSKAYYFVGFFLNVISPIQSSAVNLEGGSDAVQEAIDNIGEIIGQAAEQGLSATDLLRNKYIRSCFTSKSSQEVVEELAYSCYAKFFPDISRDDFQKMLGPD